VEEKTDQPITPCCCQRLATPGNHRGAWSAPGCSRKVEGHECQHCASVAELPAAQTALQFGLEHGRVWVGGTFVCRRRWGSDSGKSQPNCLSEVRKWACRFDCGESHRPRRARTVARNTVLACGMILSAADHSSSAGSACAQRKQRAWPIPVPPPNRRVRHTQWREAVRFMAARRTATQALDS